MIRILLAIVFIACLVPAFLLGYRRGLKKPHYGPSAEFSGIMVGCLYGCALAGLYYVVVTLLVWAGLYPD